MFHNLWLKGWDKQKIGPSKICGMQSSKNLNWCGLLKQTIILLIF